METPLYFYRPQHFPLQELVPQDLFVEYQAKGREDRLWLLLDPRILFTADRLRERFGPAFINDWPYGGSLRQCGFRNDQGTGATLSQHRFGRGLDLHFRNAQAEDIRAAMLASPMDPDWLHVTCIEEGVTWLHIDCRPHDKAASGILVVRP